MPTFAVYADTKGPGACRGCGAPITWARTVAGDKATPITGREPVPLRTEHDLMGRLIEHYDAADTHFRTCPEADRFRRGKPTKA